MEDDNLSDNTESVIGPSVKIDGDLKSRGNLRVDGTVAGKIKTAKNLLVGESANITADIEAENSVINGNVQGNVNVSGALMLGKSGKVVGDILCGSLQVQEGAYFAGKCQMQAKAAVPVLPVEETK